MALRITKNDKKKINNMRRRVKNLLAKTEKAGVDITDRIEVKYAKDFTSRAELNDYMKLASKLTNRNNREFQYKQASDGSYVSVKAINEFNLMTRIANRNRAKYKKEQAKREAELKGSAIELSAYEIASSLSDINKLPTIGKNNIPNQTRLKKMLANRRNQARRNYIDERSNEARERWLILVEDIIPNSSDVVERFRSMDVGDFWYLYTRNERMANIFYGSGGKKLNDYKTSYIETKLSELESILDKYDRDKAKTNNE